MPWELMLVVLFGGFVLLMMTGMPVAFTFMILNLTALVFFFGFDGAMANLIPSMFGSVASINLLPLPLFVLMGEVMFHAGVATNLIGALEKLVGRVPGRLGILAVLAGALQANLSGASVSSVAMLGSVLVPDMEKRGYKKAMIYGPILGGGALAAMIPPTGLGVLVGAVGEVSIGQLLVAIYIPGFLLACIYMAYIVSRCLLQPSLAPSYEVDRATWSDRIVSFVRYVAPVGLVFVAVIGVIFLGIATPTEAAATGVLGALVLAAIYRSLDWTVIKKAFMGTVHIGAMIMFIMVGATAFGNVLAYSGATRGLAEAAANAPFEPIVIVIIMQIAVLIMGFFMDPVPITLITIPIFMPIVKALGLDPLWFSVIFLLNVEMATISPPFGMCLFVMKSVAPKGTTIGDVYKAAVPIVGLQLFLMALLLAFPALSLWLPSMMLQVK